MKRRCVSAVLALSLASIGIPTTASAAVTAGAVCSKIGSTATVAGYQYTCIKSGKKLVWGKGVKVVAKKEVDSQVNVTPSPGVSATPITTSSPKLASTPSPSVTPSPYATIDTSRIIVTPSPTPSGVTQLIPKLTLLSTTFNSFVIQIVNYDPSFIWRIEPSDGYASRDGNGKVTVTGLKPSQPISVRVTASKPQFKDGFETIAVETSPESDALVPKLSILGETNSEFYVKIENFDGKFMWNVESTRGTIEEKLPGLYRIYNFGSTADPVFITVSSSRVGFKPGKSTAIKNGTGSPLPSPTPKPTTGPPTYSVSGITVNKMAITTGQSITVNFNLATTNLSDFPQPLTVLFGNINDDVYLGGAPATLASGNISSGSYTATLSLPTITPSGTYPVYIFIKGSLSVTGPSVTLTAPPPPPPPPAPTYSVSGITVNKTAITSGQSITVNFNLNTTNLSDFPQPLTVLFGNINDDVYLGGAPATLASGNISSGSYTATLSLPTITPSGTYPVYIFIKGSLSVTGPSVTLTAPPPPPPPPAPTYSVSGITVNKTVITTGQSVTVNFNLSTTNSPNLSGLYVLFGNINDDQYFNGAPATRVSGDVSSGSYTATLSLPAITPVGSYPVYVFIKGLLSVTGPSVAVNSP